MMEIVDPQIHLLSFDNHIWKNYATLYMESTTIQQMMENADLRKA